MSRISLPTAKRTRACLQLTLLRLDSSWSEALRALSLSIVNAGQGVVINPEEVAPDADAMTEKLAKFFDTPADDARLLGALYDGTLIGSADAWRLPRARLHRAALFTLGVHPDWQGQGVGRALTQPAFD